MPSMRVRSGLEGSDEREGAGMSDIPNAVWEGTFTLFGIEMRCYVLDTGQRVMDGKDLAKFFRAIGKKEMTQDEKGLMDFIRWTKGMP